ncbi:MAG: 50S ribosomal protein L13 [Candidatus Norongarragalinales archaeon]
MIVINGEKAVFGRVLAFAAKKLQEGEDVVVVNAEKTVISGNPERIIARYHAKRGISNKGNPEHAPKFPVRPDLFLKYILRGMLPKKKASGKKAREKFKAFLGMPKEFEGKAQKFYKTSEDLSVSFVSLEEICKRLGWKRA